MLVAGPNLALLKQHQGYAAVASQAKQQEQKTIQGLRGNLDKRSTVASQQQHLDQENLCLRTGKCSNGGLGEQTLGNDNSVTGFADQSKNVQNRVVVTPTSIVTPTPIVTPTSVVTPTPTPTPSNCNGIEDDEQANIIGDPDTLQPPGVVCPPGEDEPAGTPGEDESAEAFVLDGTS
jgi:hypothetical protein